MSFALVGVEGIFKDGSTGPNRLVDKISTRGRIGWFVETHDLAASKLAAYREKDRDFVRTLFIEGMIAPETPIDRISLLNIDEELRDRLLQWI